MYKFNQVIDDGDLCGRIRSAVFSIMSVTKSNGHVCGKWKSRDHFKVIREVNIKIKTEVGCDMCIYIYIYKIIIHIYWHNTENYSSFNRTYGPASYNSFGRNGLTCWGQVVIISLVIDYFKLLAQLYCIKLWPIAVIKVSNMDVTNRKVHYLDRIMLCCVSGNKSFLLVSVMLSP